MTIQSSWVEIACDESGFSGSNLLDPASPVITHASVDLAVPEAAEVVAVLRSRLRRASEYKSNQLLRPEQRPALEWFLTALRRACARPRHRQDRIRRRPGARVVHRGTVVRRGHQPRPGSLRCRARASAADRVPGGVRGPDPDEAGPD